MRRLISFVGALALMLSVLTSVPAQAQTTEFRGFWADAFHSGFKTPEQVNKLVADAKRSNANAIIAQVRRRGDAYYTSTIEPRTNDPELAPGFDALQDLIDKAHAEGIEVHAWLATLPVYLAGRTTTDPAHVWQQHGPTAPGSANWAMLTDTGFAPGYLDPGHPDAVDYTVSVYLDVLRRYDVDGVHMDYVRYGAPNWGYNPTAVARFNALHGRTGKPAPTDPVWMQWRREQVTNLVRKLYVESMAIKPEAKISGALIAFGSGPTTEQGWYETRTYNEVLQDWRAWQEEGIIDIAMPMNYDREFNALQKLWYDQWITYEKDHQYQRHTTIGPGTYLNYIEDGIAQLRRAQAPSPSGNYARGQQIYSYAATNMYTNDDLLAGGTASLPRRPWRYVPESNEWFYTALSQPTSYVDPANGQTYSTEPVWPTPAVVPEMPWKTQPTTGAVKGQVMTRDGQRFDSMTVTLEPLSAEQASRTLYTNGNGWFGGIELAPGTYMATVNVANQSYTGQTQRAITIRAGEVTTVDFDKLVQHERGKPSDAPARPYVPPTAEEQAQIEDLGE